MQISRPDRGHLNQDSETVTKKINKKLLISIFE